MCLSLKNNFRYSYEPIIIAHAGVTLAIRGITPKFKKNIKQKFITKIIIISIYYFLNMYLIKTEKLF